MTSEKFYGTGESLVFSFYKGDRIHSYASTGANDYFIYTDDIMIAFGCS